MVFHGGKGGGNVKWSWGLVVEVISSSDMRLVPLGEDRVAWRLRIGEVNSQVPPACQCI